MTEKNFGVHQRCADADSRTPLVVSFANSAYLPLLQLWLSRLESLGIRRVRVYCMDAPTAQWCEAHQIDGARIIWSGDLCDLWVQRIRIFHQLLEAGEAFIHSDIDAVWIRNPLKVGAAATASEDLLFSQGTVWPPDIHQSWGFVLCCGWFRARPTDAVKSFFRSLETHVRDTGDDQISVNRLLHSLGIHWAVAADGYQLPFRDRLMQCWPRALRGATPGERSLSVALLPHREFQRLPENDEHVVVKHLLTPKNCASKLAALRAHGLIEAAGVRADA